jgi:tetratricopeptide (TPR) repeat protein
MNNEPEDLWAERDRTLPRPEGEGQERDPEEFFRAGVFLLKRDKAREALIAFKHALQMKGAEPRYKSYFGVSLALSEGKVKEALLFCESAVEKEFYRAELFLNLARVYLMAGNRRKAHAVLRKGLAIDRDSRDIRQELDKMGIRKPPVLPFLDRRHPLNKLAGKVLHRLRLR